MLAQTQQGGSLTAEQKEFYNREGYLVLEELLSEGDLASGREALCQRVDLIAQELLSDGLIDDVLAEAPFSNRLARLFDGLTDAHFLRYGRSWRDRFPGYFELMAQPKILDAVESLIGSEIFSNPVYNARPKVPRVAAGAVPWHQDKSYWPDANANPVITVWIPFVDANLENGCLHLIPRTHTRRVLKYGAESYTGTGYTEVYSGFVEKRRAQILPLPVKAGTAVLFNDRLVHSSTPNRSDSVRWSVDLRYQPTDQDPMPGHGAGFLARSRRHPEQVADLDDWLAHRLYHQPN